MCKEEQDEPCQSLTKWPPVGHWCEVLWPNNQKQTSWGWPEGPTSSSWPCAHCPAPWSSIGICHWTPELAGLPLAPCAFHRREQVHPEHVTDVKGSGEAVENVMLPVTSFSMTGFGGWSVMVWGGMSMEGRTDLYRLDNDTLTAIRFLDYPAASFFLLIIYFHQTMWHPLIPNTLPSPYQYRYPAWYFLYWNLMCFQSAPLIFWSVYYIVPTVNIISGYAITSMRTTIQSMSILFCLNEKNVKH